MIFSGTGIAASMAVLAGTNYMSQVNIGGPAPGFASAVLLFAFNTFFAIGWLGIPCEFVLYSAVGFI